MLIASLTVTFFGDRTSALVQPVALAGWLVLAVADLARGLRIRRHPYASARWLVGVRIAVGDETSGRALEHLKTCFCRDETYVVRRADMALGISIVRAYQRDSRRRAEGNMLATFVGPQTSSQKRHGKNEGRPPMPGAAGSRVRAVAEPVIGAPYPGQGTGLEILRRVVTGLTALRHGA